MSEEKPKQNDKPSKPSHIAYQVRDGGEGKSFFNRVGSAFAHGDCKGSTSSSIPCQQMDE